MTYQARREPRTLMQRMGFLDPDLGDPLHAEIIHWIDTALRTGSFEELGLSRFRQMHRNHLVWHEWEYPVKNTKASIAGFLDVCAAFRSDISPDFIWYAGLETKVSIPDLPTLFRQLQVYRTFGYRNLIVACLGDVSARDVATIRAQGYEFVKPCLDLPK